MNNELQQTPDNKWNDGDNRHVYDDIPPALPVPSTVQLGIWLAEQIPPHTPVYGSGQYTTIWSFIDTIVFEESRCAVIQKAGMLHCQYTEINGTLQPSVVPLANWSLTVIDFSSKSNSVGDAKLWRDVDSETPCDMKRPPLFFFSLLKIDANGFIWYQHYHHSVIDGHSVALTARGLASIYSKRMRNLEEGTPFYRLPHLAGNSISYLNSLSFERDKEYLISRFSDSPAVFFSCNA
ncbi:TPA: hypothetical protein N3A49_004108 [Salmonella enterica subsp. salamae serovar 56:l,v:z39]|nr:hypothetical protein [Salmonella enterica subsp. salamae serovar 56:l,v:z39]